MAKRTRDKRIAEAESQCKREIAQHRAECRRLGSSTKVKHSRDRMMIGSKNRRDEKIMDARDDYKWDLHYLSIQQDGLMAGAMSF